jgi:Holliday junction resolvase RusA-like endonuclease
VSYRLEFELAGLPPMENGHKHWAVAGKARREWRARTRMRVFMQRPPEPLTSVRIVCTRFSSVEPDRDNLARSFKSVIDGLKDGGIIKDDKPSIVKQFVSLWEKAARDKGKIRVLVEAV